MGTSLESLQPVVIRKKVQNADSERSQTIRSRAGRVVPDVRLRVLGNSEDIRTLNMQHVARLQQSLERNYSY